MAGLATPHAWTGERFNMARVGLDEIDAMPLWTDVKARFALGTAPVTSAVTDPENTMIIEFGAKNNTKKKESCFVVADKNSLKENEHRLIYSFPHINSQLTGYADESAFPVDADFSATRMLPIMKEIGRGKTEKFVKYAPRLKTSNFGAAAYPTKFTLGRSSQHYLALCASLGAACSDRDHNYSLYWESVKSAVDSIDKEGASDIGDTEEVFGMPLRPHAFAIYETMAALEATEFLRMGVKPDEARLAREQILNEMLPSRLSVGETINVNFTNSVELEDFLKWCCEAEEEGKEYAKKIRQLTSCVLLWQPYVDHKTQKFSNDKMIERVRQLKTQFIEWLCRGETPESVERAQRVFTDKPKAAFSTLVQSIISLDNEEEQKACIKNSRWIALLDAIHWYPNVKTPKISAKDYTALETGDQDFVKEHAEHVAEMLCGMTAVPIVLIQNIEMRLSGTQYEADSKFYVKVNRESSFLPDSRNRKTAFAGSVVLGPTPMVSELGACASVHSRMLKYFDSHGNLIGQPIEIEAQNLNTDSSVGNGYYNPFFVLAHDEDNTHMWVTACGDDKTIDRQKPVFGPKFVALLTQRASVKKNWSAMQSPSDTFNLESACYEIENKKMCQILDMPKKGGVKCVELTDVDEITLATNFHELTKETLGDEVHEIGIPTVLGKCARWNNSFEALKKHVFGNESLKIDMIPAGLRVRVRASGKNQFQVVPNVLCEYVTILYNQVMAMDGDHSDFQAVHDNNIKQWKLLQKALQGVGAPLVQLVPQQQPQVHHHHHHPHHQRQQQNVIETGDDMEIDFKAEAIFQDDDGFAEMDGDDDRYRIPSVTPAVTSAWLRAFADPSPTF